MLLRPFFAASAVLLIALPARAERKHDGVTLTYLPSPAAVPLCPEADYLENEVFVRLGYELFQPKGPMHLTVKIDRANGQFRAAGEMRDDEGKVLLTGTYAAMDCTFAVFSVAVAVCIHFTEPPEPPPPPPPPCPVVPPPSPLPVPEPTPPPTPPAPPTASPPLPEPRRVQAGLASVFSFGAAPSVLGGVGGFVGVRWPSVSLAFEGRALFAPSATLARATTVRDGYHFDFAAISGTACLHPAWAFLCARAEAGSLFASAPVEGAPVFADLNAPTVCGACKCDVPAGTCTLPTSLSAASASCPGDGAGIVHTPFDAPAGWSGSCSAASPIPANQKCNGVNCVQSLTIAPLALAETPCAVSVDPVAAKLPHTWGTAARSCHGVAYGPCATSDEVCAPAAAPGFAQCLVRDGDRECPAPYTVRNVFYSGLTDTRECSPCTCSAPIGGACAALVSVYKDGACSSSSLVGSFPIDAAGSKCFDIPSGQALGSKLAAEPTYAPGACQASGGEPTGQALPEGPSTYCCLP